MTVRALYDAVATRYDDLVTETRYVGPAWLKGVLPTIPEPKRAVDFGCANGALGRLLRSNFPDAHISGFDISPLMVAEAKQSGAYDEVFVHDLNEPVAHVAHSSLQLVVALGFVEFLEKPAAFIADVARLLAPGGEFLVSFQEHWPGRDKLAPRSTRSGEVTHYAHSVAEVEDLFRVQPFAVESVASTTAYISRSGFACPYVMVRSKRLGSSFPRSSSDG